MCCILCCDLGERFFEIGLGNGVLVTMEHDVHRLIPAQSNDALLEIIEETQFNCYCSRSCFCKRQSRA